MQMPREQRNVNLAQILLDMAATGNTIEDEIQFYHEGGEADMIELINVEMVLIDSITEQDVLAAVEKLVEERLYEALHKELVLMLGYDTNQVYDFWQEAIENGSFQPPLARLVEDFKTYINEN